MGENRFSCKFPFSLCVFTISLLLFWFFFLVRHFSLFSFFGSVLCNGIFYTVYIYIWLRCLFMFNEPTTTSVNHFVYKKVMLSISSSIIFYTFFSLIIYSVRREEINVTVSGWKCAYFFFVFLFCILPHTHTHTNKNQTKTRYPIILVVHALNYHFFLVDSVVCS